MGLLERVNCHWCGRLLWERGVAVWGPGVGSAEVPHCDCAPPERMAWEKCCPSCGSGITFEDGVYSCTGDNYRSSIHCGFQTRDLSKLASKEAEWEAERSAQNRGLLIDWQVSDFGRGRGIFGR